VAAAVCATRVVYRRGGIAMAKQRVGIVDRKTKV
jgi:hypothetical protein